MNCLLFCIAIVSSSVSFAKEEPVCHKCEIIRENNKKHPGDYEYYEDYLKHQKEDAKPAPELKK